MTVSPAQYRGLVGYIDASLVPAEQPVAPGYGTTDLFYAARGRFSLITSCNVWIASGLRQSGLPTGFWTPFAFQVLSHL